MLNSNLGCLHSPNCRTTATSTREKGVLHLLKKKKKKKKKGQVERRLFLFELDSDTSLDKAIWKKWFGVEANETRGKLNARLSTKLGLYNC